MLLIGNGRLITRSAVNPYVEDGAVVLDGEVVRETGTLAELKAKYPDAEFVDAHGGVMEIRYTIAVDHQVTGMSHFKIRVRESMR